MVDVSEHFYTDDPAQGPADVRTTLPGIAYYFLGNGHLQAAVQVCSGQEGSPLGLLIMDPARLGPKRAALTFDAAAGLAGTAVRLRWGRQEAAARAGAVDAAWTTVAGIPAVRVRWGASALSLEETFFCPDRTRPRLLRRLRLRAGADFAAGGPVTVSTGPTGAGLSTQLLPAPGKTADIALQYAIDPQDGLIVTWCNDPLPEEAAGRFWRGLAQCEFPADEAGATLDHLFQSARRHLPAVIAATGVMDGSIWQYNREWVRDQAMVVIALTMLGASELAGIMIERLLREFVTAAGDTVDSSVQRPPADIELDQNGELLLALATYVAWTGDRDIVRRYWPCIRSVADFPLQEVFRHPRSGLLQNCREYWERHAGYGITPGVELTYQLFVALGLSQAAQLAGLVNQPADARRWRSAARQLKQAILAEDGWGLVHEGRLIKRRDPDGGVADEISLPAAAGFPPGIPLAQPGRHFLLPDSSVALPIAFQFVDPRGELTRRTLDDLERLWNQNWQGGGYARYNITSEGDSPGPWPFASLFIARALLEAEQDHRVWRVLRWLNSIPGARAGSWFEFYGPRISPPCPQVGIPPWTWAEIVIFCTHHLLGVRPGLDGLTVRPRLLRGLAFADAELTMEGHRVRLQVRRASGRAAGGFRVAGVTHGAEHGTLYLPRPRRDLNIEVELPDQVR